MMRITVGALKRIIRETAEVNDQAARDEIASIYSDVYKEKHGIRPRWMNWEGMSTAEMQAELDRLYDEPSSYDDWEPEPSEFDYPPPEGNVSHEEMMSVDPREALPTRMGMGRRS